MIQAPLEVYRIDMKYIRNLHNIDAQILIEWKQNVRNLPKRENRIILGDIYYVIFQV